MHFVALSLLRLARVSDPDAFTAARVELTSSTDASNRDSSSSDVSRSSSGNSKSLGTPAIESGGNTSSKPADYLKTKSPRKQLNHNGIHKVNIKMLKTLDLGEYELPASTTLHQLRERIKERHGSAVDDMVFVDLTVKRRLHDEKNATLGSVGTAVLTDRGRTIDQVLAECCVQGLEKVVSIQRGGQTFEVRV
jgi:hypothetical protein